MKSKQPVGSPRPLKSRAKAFSYLRFSTLEQAAGDSHRRQTSLAEAYATEHGLELDSSLSYQDLGVSAFRSSNTAVGKLGEFLQAVRSGLVPRNSYLLVESLDRISRDYAYDAMQTLGDICKEGITVVTLADRRLYTIDLLRRDPTAMLMSVLIFLRAHEESATKALRLRQVWKAKRAKAADGGRMTSMVPAWLYAEEESGEIKLDPERGAVVRRIFKAYSEGQGIVLITKTLNQEGVDTFPSPNGKKATQWHPSYINRILRNPAAMGTYQPTETFFREEGRRTRQRRPSGEGIADYFPAAVKEPLFQRVQAMLQPTNGQKTPQPTRGTAANEELQNVFGGLARCSLCDTTVRRTVKTGKLATGERKAYVYLVCTKATQGAGCGYRATNYDAVEAGFMAAVGELFAFAPKAGGDTTLEDKLKSADAALMVAEEAQGKIRNRMMETGSSVLMEDLQAAAEEVQRLRAERETIAAQLETGSSALLSTRLADLRKALNAEPMDRREVNALLRSVLSKVVLDADARVGALVWKHGGRSEFVFGLPDEVKTSATKPDKLKRSPRQPRGPRK